MVDVPVKSRIDTTLDDPGTAAIARTYAEAFLDSAGDRSDEAVEEFESFVTDVLAASAEFERVFTSGLTNRDEKFGIIERVVAPRASEHFTNFLKVLGHHDRLDLLKPILASAILENEKRNGQQRVQVVSAKPLDEATLQKVKERVAAAFNFEPILEPQTDPHLLGGVVIRVGNSVYDGSLRTWLNQLAKRLRQGSLHEIQSGRDRFSHPEGD